MLDIYKIIENTTVEGPYRRFCIWTQGCKKHCKGCWAKDTWKFNAGKKYSVDELFSLIKKQEKNIDGVTFLGGEPFEQAQELSLLAEKIKQIGLSLVTFSGYTLDELQSKNNTYINKLLSNTDLLIDGGFEIENYDLSHPWVGSSNQRYIFLTDRFSLKEIETFKNQVEVRISKDGTLQMNGMGDFKKLKEKFCLQLGQDSV